METITISNLLKELRANRTKQVHVCVVNETSATTVQLNGKGYALSNAGESLVQRAVNAIGNELWQFDKIMDTADVQAGRLAKNIYTQIISQPACSPTSPSRKLSRDESDRQQHEQHDAHRATIVSLIKETLHIDAENVWYMPENSLPTIYRRFGWRFSEKCNSTALTYLGRTVDEAREAVELLAQERTERIERMRENAEKWASIDNVIATKILF